MICLPATGKTSLHCGHQGLGYLSARWNKKVEKLCGYQDLDREPNNKTIHIIISAGRGSTSCLK